MSEYWIAVASAEHVRRGRAGGFMQICHGKAAPLSRIRAGSGIVYYSPQSMMGLNDRLQAFTAIGFVKPGEPYLAEMENGVRAFRRYVDWLAGHEVPIRQLIDTLELTANRPNWGYRLRFGRCQVSARDFDTIAGAMCGGHQSQFTAA
jgi:hypothetical protein